MDLFIINAEDYKLDGGACFGVVPKVMWSKLYKTDENNLLPISIRCLLVKTENKLILFDAGIGNKQDEKFLGHLGIFSEPDILKKSFHKSGFSFDDVTDVVFTHLHFDHVGGAVKKNADLKGYELVFKNADYCCSSQQWNWAMNSNKREIASYLMENLLPIKESGKLNFIDKTTKFDTGVELRLFNGHTDGQIIPFLNYKGKTIVFTADFIASVGNIPLPYIPSFDTRPLISMEEKEEFLKEAAANNYILLFQHDYINECCTVVNTEKGVRVKDIFMFAEI
jgi:glyoxylase-like metal-dependent hydrolase (beta-lactamase superfamily II)